MKPMNRTILHVDMDAFFAAIEQHDHPKLQGKPVVVGAPPDRRGVVSTASYEARVFGIHSAMPSRTAAQRCPHAIFLPVRGDRYREVSDQVMDVFDEFTPLVEQISIDEAFLDVVGATRLWGDPPTLARKLKERVKAATGLTASVGVAPNKFLAKLASDLDKPDGLTLVPADPDKMRAFLAPLPVERIWGVGKAASAKFRAARIRTIGDVQALSEQTLQHLFGRAFGAHVWRLARGLDDRHVEGGREAKSISNEYTFDEDCRDPGILRSRMIALTEHVAWRLRRAKMWARTGHIKIRFEDFSTFTRQQALSGPTRSERALLSCALSLYGKEEISRPVRLLGFGVSHLTDTAPSEKQPSLFPEMDGPVADKREDALDEAVDRMRDTYGRSAVSRGLWTRPRKGDEEV